MSQIRDWKKKKLASQGKLPLDSLSEKDVRHLVERLLLQNPDMLPRALNITRLSVADDVVLPGDGERDPAQTIMYTAPMYNGMVIRYTEDGHYIMPDWGDSEELVSDGVVPDPVETIEAIGGKAFIHLKWTPIIHPHRFQYNVHISASSSFTPDETNQVTTTVGDQVWIRALADGSPLLLDTDYYMQVVAEDVDGEAAPSPEVSARLDTLASGDVTFGSITAQQLEASLVLATTVIAGNSPPGSRIEFGITEHESNEMIGLHAFDTEDMITFMIDAEDGSVYIRGTVDFGTGSRLLDSDVIELLEQSTDAFYVPGLVQTVGGTTGYLSEGAKTTVSATWSFPTTAGNQPLAYLAIYDPDGTAPTPSTPSGWTLDLSQTHSDNDFKLLAYYANSTASQSGTKTWTLNDTIYAILILAEAYGIEVPAANESVSFGVADADVSSAATATPSQDSNLGIGIVAHKLGAGAGNYAYGLTSSGSLGLVTSKAIAESTHTTGLSRYHYRMSIWSETQLTAAPVEMEGTLSGDQDWIAMAFVYNAAPVGVSTPEADKVRLYAKDVSDVSTLHTMSEDAEEHSLTLSPTDERWELLHLTGSLNIGSEVAGAAGQTSITVTGLLTGDIVFGASGASLDARAFALRPRVPVASDNTLIIDWVNGSEGTLNPDAVTLHFLVLRKTT